MFSKYKKILFVQLLITILGCVLSCQAKEEVYTDNGSRIANVVIDTSDMKKDSVFKLWLIDTLSILTLDTFSSTQKKLESIRTNDINVMPDSLGLSISHYYDLIVGSKNNFKKGMYSANVLSLLGEYGEYPKVNSRLSFTVNYFFSPSPVSELARDLIEEIKNIKTIELNGKVSSEYNYIRGRLSEKFVTTVDRSGTKRKEHIAFIWEKNKLVKKRLE